MLTLSWMTGNFRLKSSHSTSADVLRVNRISILQTILRIHQAGVRFDDALENPVFFKSRDQKPAYCMTNLALGKLHETPCQWPFDFKEHFEAHRYGKNEVVKQGALSEYCADLYTLAEELNYWDESKAAALFGALGWNH